MKEEVNFRDKEKCCWAGLKANPKVKYQRVWDN